MPQINVKMQNGEEHLIPKIGIADQIAFERKYGVSITALEADAKLEWIAYVAHAAMKRFKLIDEDSDFEAFIAEVDDFEISSSETNGDAPKGLAPEAPTT